MHLLDFHPTGLWLPPLTSGHSIHPVAVSPPALPDVTGCVVAWEKHGLKEDGGGGAKTNMPCMKWRGVVVIRLVGHLICSPGSSRSPGALRLPEEIMEKGTQHACAIANIKKKKKNEIQRRKEKENSKILHVSMMNYL